MLIIICSPIYKKVSASSFVFFNLLICSLFLNYNYILDLYAITVEYKT